MCEQPEKWSNALAPFRERIDKIDQTIIDLLAVRFKVASEVAVFKAERKIPARLAGRIAAVIADREQQARLNNLPAGLVSRIWTILVNETCDFEERSIEQHKAEHGGHS